jgi:hypothetical protein
MKYIKTPASITKPGWSKRNKKIATFIEHDKSVLDLGCGARDLLKYITPSRYTGIDYNSEYADLTINFNQHFTLPPGLWNYVIVSGVLEYLHDANHFLKQIKNAGETYIITMWWRYKNIENPAQLPSFYDYGRIIEDNFTIVDTSKWKNHTIYICKDKL